VIPRFLRPLDKRCKNRFFLCKKKAVDWKSSFQVGRLLSLSKQPALVSFASRDAKFSLWITSQTAGG
jgi:hypothetical protein